MSVCEPCGKHSYRSVRMAIRVALRRSKAAGIPLRWYRCPRGNGWHLTSKTTNAKEAS